MKSGTEWEQNGAQVGPNLQPYICACPRLSGLPSAVHCGRGRQRRRPWSASGDNHGPMQAMAAGYPLQRVGMDILGSQDKTPSRNWYVLVLMDYFTKWTAAFPLANIEASTVAKVLAEKYIACFGAPDYLQSDQGRSFEASVVL
ncbi:conserved hypothetical protein [Trichinella spiralis]|uniref:Pro-Pol polyprotein n=1 Tax=Trichinella spiralis TaxID=6334 RepID=E5SPC2_TRISP|nr:conserved hypothetical protein [Trichinella spiralis]KRY41305.1 Pro-Pol polyprotein [Trichinella spiralis]